MTDNLTHVYGYKIGEYILFQLADRTLFNTRRVSKVSHKINSLKLRSTMSLLLCYLLENANGKVVSDDELLFYVWDQNGLKGSNHRLWEVMNELKRKVKELGMEEDIILRINSNGYFIKDGYVSPLFYPSD
ncbi:winged helix-turn-helix domain-containing protein [Enterobacter hormaechei]